MPVQVCGAASDGGVPCTSFLTGVTAISAGAEHTCAVTEGSVVCWGDNSGAALGPETDATWTTVPVAVPNVSGATALACAQDLSCALLSAGTVMCWGSNVYDEIGDGMPTSGNGVTPPTAVVDLTNVTAVSAPNLGYSACALSAGTVMCWGLDSNGNLGNGSTTNTPAPVAVRSSSTNHALSGVTAIAGGACALLDGGTVECWGPGEEGQLGNGATSSSGESTVVIY
jgi:alpha-tubulin suppressor-like RCC1 family protein